MSNKYWSQNDVKMLFHRLIHTAATKGVGILNDKALEEVREYIKSTEEVINNELIDAMYESRNSGRTVFQEIAMRYHTITGVPIPEAREFAKAWMENARDSLENSFGKAM